MTKIRWLRTLVLAVWFVLLASAAVDSAFAASPPALTNSVAIDDVTVSYPDGWSVLRSGSLTTIVAVPTEQQATLGSQFVFTPHVSVSIEQRTDGADALSRL